MKVVLFALLFISAVAKSQDWEKVTDTIHVKWALINGVAISPTNYNSNIELALKCYTSYIIAIYDCDIIRKYEREIPPVNLPKYYADHIQKQIKNTRYYVGGKLIDVFQYKE